MITSNTSCGSYQGVELKYEGMIVIYHLRQTPLSQHEASYLSRKYLVYATKPRRLRPTQAVVHISQWSWNTKGY